MSKTYYTYRIHIANDERVQVEKWNAQHQSLGKPSGAFRYRDRLENITPLLQKTHNGDLRDYREVRTLGESLFDALFDDVLCQDFVNFYYQVVQKEKQLLRVELDIDERVIPDVAALPWEFMCLPTRANSGEIWLGTDPNLVFSRNRHQWNPAPLIQLNRAEKLRIALAIAAPKGSTELGAVVYNKIQTALEKLATCQPERVELLPIVNPATLDAIDALLEKQPHIFHFIGHGRLRNESGEEVGEIALVDDILDEARWVNAGLFSGLFNRHRPGIVVLQACEGGMLSASQAFVGVASKVVQQNIPVVVAMQYEVFNATASRFAYRFYERLAQDDPVDIAVQNGRHLIALKTEYQKRDFATPIVFMRVQDGYLFQWQGDDQSCYVNTDANRQVIQEEFKSPQVEYGYSSRQGLEALTGLMSNPEVRAAVVAFRTDFEAAREHIEVLGHYKDLHDLLHTLELQCYSSLVQEIRRFPSDDTGLDILRDCLLTLQQIVEDIHRVTSKLALATSETLWIRDLEHAQGSLQEAIEKSDEPQLQITILRINQILETLPSQINTRLNTVARSLRLPALVQGITYILGYMSDSNLEPERISQFQNGVSVLTKLDGGLATLVKNHDEWQAIDLRLRQIGVSLEDTILKLEMSWPYLKTMSELQCIGSEESWAQSFKEECENLESAIITKNTVKVKQYFRSYRRRVSLRFYKVDRDLKQLCGDLRTVGESLAFVLRIIA